MKKFIRVFLYKKSRTAFFLRIFAKNNFDGYTENFAINEGGFELQNFEMKTKVFFGENALDHILEKNTGCAFVIADPFAVKSGLINEVTERLEKTGMRYKIWDDVVPDPPMDRVIAGVKKALEIHSDCLMAVGGGSAMDYTKAVRMFARRTDPTFDPKFIAIPTTSGTGSEVTEVAVITDAEKKTKVPICSKELIADEAILDAELVKTVPKNITADTGMDIMTHAIEAFVSTDRNDFSDALAERAIKLCGCYLGRSYSDPNDMEAKEKIHVASCMAGIAFNSAGLGLNHGMAHQLGARFHIPHGRANAILLPYIIGYNAGASAPGGKYSSCVKKYCEIATSLGITNYDDVSTVRSLMNYLRMLSKDMDMPGCIKDIGNISEEEYFAAIDKMTEDALLDATTQTNPRVPTKEDVAAIYKDIWNSEHTGI